jgi:hypothetical protein
MIQALFQRSMICWLAIHPAYDRTVTCHDHLFGFEYCGGVACEPCPPEFDYCRSPFDPLTVGRGRRILENGVIGQQTRQSVRIVPVERLIQTIDDHAGRLSRRHRILLDSHQQLASQAVEAKAER